MAQQASATKHDDKGNVRNVNDYDYGVLFKYARRGDWPSMERLLKGNQDALNKKLGPLGNTVLHVAAQAGNVKMAVKLVDLITPEALEIKNDEGHTAFHDAAIGGIVQMAACMLQKNPKLIAIVKERSCLPVTLAFEYKRREMSTYLLSKTTPEVLSQQHGIWELVFLESAIRSHMLDLVLKALDDHPRLVTAKYDDDDDPRNYGLLMVLCMTPGIFPSSGLKLLGYWQRWLYSCIHLPPVTSIGVQCQSQPKSKLQGLVRNFLGLLGVNQMYDLKMIHACSSRLLDRACEYISTLNYTDSDKIGLDSYIHLAAEYGIVELIVKIIEVRPDLFNVPNRDGRDAIMMSIVNRHEKIFSLWYGLRETYHKGKRTTNLDKQGNTILHLAGQLSPSTVLACIPGAALQMQRDLQWYKEVEGIVNPATKFVENHVGKIPDQVFFESHKELVERGEKWMKDTASSCTVVGALIITIMFAAAFTVPGGNIEGIGIPIFLHKKAFTTFMVSDAISLLASTTSILMFLGILTSRYSQEDFLKSLPTKLIIGLSMLFISIAAMMVAFCGALILTVNGRLEVIIPIVVFACIPVTLFMFLQFPLLVEIVKSTYGPGIFDRKMKPLY